MLIKNSIQSLPRRQQKSRISLQSLPSNEAPLSGVERSRDLVQPALSQDYWWFYFYSSLMVLTKSRTLTTSILHSDLVHPRLCSCSYSATHLKMTAPLGGCKIKWIWSILWQNNDGPRPLVKKARNVYEGALKDIPLANRQGLDHAWSALLGAGRAKSTDGKVSLLPVEVLTRIISTCVGNSHMKRLRAWSNSVLWLQRSRKMSTS